MTTDFKALEREFDKSQFGGLLHAFPDQLVHAGILAAQAKLPNPKKWENIVICGMGGSGIGGNLVSDLVFSEIRIPIQCIADYELPRFVSSKTLVIAVSYSGDTEETLSCVSQAHDRKATVIVIASGGKLPSKSRFSVLVPSGYPPRAAIAYLFVAVLTVLSRLKLVSKKGEALTAAIRLLRHERELIQRHTQETAQKIADKFIVAYTGRLFGSVANRFLKQFTENAKMMVHYNIIPEHNHNEINAMNSIPNAHFILLQSAFDLPQVTKRFGFVTKQLPATSVTHFHAKGDTLLEQQLYTLYFVDYLSYYTALLRRVDPSAIPLITALKKHLA